MYQERSGIFSSGNGLLTDALRCVRVFFMLGIILTILSSGLLAQTAIGGSMPDNSAMLDVQASNRGVLFPRLNDQQRSTISFPATGLMIFNTTSSCLEINLGTPSNAVWSSLRCTTWDTLSTINCSNPTVTGTIYNGEPASGVRATISYSGGGGGTLALQTVSSTVVTGLSATLAESVINTGSGTLNIDITGTPTGTGNASFTFNIGGQSCSFSVPVLPLCRAKVNATDYIKFMCHNLGSANTDANPFSPSYAINGGYWQWGTYAQGAPGPTGPGVMEANEGSVSGWNTTVVPPDGSWLDGFKTSNDPCPAGFQVPSRAIWVSVTANNPIAYEGSFTPGINNYDSGLRLGSELFLPAAGFRNSGDGSSVLRGSLGNYWTSTLWFANQGYIFFFNNNTNITYTDSRMFGYSVRCVEDR